MSSVEQRLLDMKEDIDRAKTKKAQLEGAQTQLRKQMDAEFGCETVKAAEKKVDEFKATTEMLKDKIDTRVTKLSKKYGLEI